MTVRNFTPQSNEKIQYISPDGVVFDLQDPPDRHVLLYEGDGMADMDYGTTSGPYQHGDTVTEVRLVPRTIDVVIRQNGCDRDAYWEIRTLVDNMLRPNRTDMNAPIPGVLRRVTNDGTVRDLDVFVSKGPTYTWSHGGWDEFSISESLRFTAHNPVLYDPVELYATLVNLFVFPPTHIDLVFPMQFPFFFGGPQGSIVEQSIAITYLGNWESYPTIRVQGPATDFKIVHQQLGDMISFAGYTIAEDEFITIDLNYARKTVMSSLGGSWLGKVSDDSTLTAFRIEADPVVPGGLNTFDVSLTQGNISTQVIMFYKNRFEGLDNNA
jgi:hypothetical protein